MKFKYLVVLVLVLVAVIVSVGFFHLNQNSSPEINVTSNVSDIKGNNSTDLDKTGTDENSSNSEVNSNNVKKDSSSHEVKVPKGYKLSYNEAMEYAKKATKYTFKNTDMDVYPKFNGFSKMYGKLYWEFEVRDRKTGEWIDGFQIEDSTGKATKP